MRGQSEIIGLVLIMVLVAIGFLLYIRFSLMDDKDDAAASIQESQLGQTFLNSLLKASVACGARTYELESLVQRTATGRTAQDCDGPAALQDYVNNVLAQTLDAWGINYNLTFVRRQGGSEEVLSQIGSFSNSRIPDAERCGPGKDRQADTALVQLYPEPGSVILRLERCG